MSDLVAYFRARTPEMLVLLRQLVEHESPTSSKTHVDALGALLADHCLKLGAQVTLVPFETVGDVLLAKWNADAPGKPIMLLAHHDTVWPVGTLETMPLREEDDIIYGPGVVDMKGGIVVALQALRGLIDRDALPNRPIWLFSNSEEETGALHTRDLICETAREVGLVLVVEPAAEGEAIKTWRKGIARYTVHTKGRAAHSGQAPEQGINAIIEAAHQALAIHALNDLPNGTSTSVNMLNGGIAMNVIPPEASLTVDVRFMMASEAQRVDQAMKQLGPTLPGAQVIVEGGIDRGPLERNDMMLRAFGQLREIAASIGLEQLREEGSGGASDGNFTAAMGIPTLDGMGAGGSGLHAAHEQVHIWSLHRRAALLAQTLIAWDMGRV